MLLPMLAMACNVQQRDCNMPADMQWGPRARNCGVKLTQLRQAVASGRRCTLVACLCQCSAARAGCPCRERCLGWPWGARLAQAARRLAAFLARCSGGQLRCSLMFVAWPAAGSLFNARQHTAACTVNKSSSDIRGGVWTKRVLRLSHVQPARGCSCGKASSFALVNAWVAKGHLRQHAMPSDGHFDDVDVTALSGVKLTVCARTCARASRWFEVAHRAPRGHSEFRQLSRNSQTSLAQAFERHTLKGSSSAVRAGRELCCAVQQTSRA